MHEQDLGGGDRIFLVSPQTHLEPKPTVVRLVNELSHVSTSPFDAGSTAFLVHDSLFFNNPLLTLIIIRRPQTTNGAPLQNLVHSFTLVSLTTYNRNRVFFLVLLLPLFVLRETSWCIDLVSTPAPPPAHQAYHHRQKYHHGTSCRGRHWEREGPYFHHDYRDETIIINTNQ